MKDSSWKALKIMKLPADEEGIFLERPNRFLGKVALKGKTVMVHVHDPGRLPDLLFPGTPVLLKHAQSPKRKTAFSLIAARKDNHWIFVNSGYHRRLTGALLKKLGQEIFPGLKEFQAEPKFDGGRLDYLLKFKSQEEMLVEVKGCTWAKGEIALFPDAPTTRGQKHLRHLLELKQKGLNACLWLLVFRPEATCFRPAEEIDPLFAGLFSEALKEGLTLKISRILYDGKNLFFGGELPLCSA
ncbi:DNA/RNA nuclease SfsA [Thermodesulfatator autotrophicus]|uniref:Sugar fermentation stimulation protein homolog n=1 Tax=Thermodesulfatator autotrophicus TaxID=1795632 RepID=A0A177E940_9BACT|nr:DNA/RNA nuclease SfsA [Thermodesulfatator autotrophicus]OAG28011.1 hypothetical protein TH606_04025 [Thermodesulfatator autotrophicus]